MLTKDPLKGISLLLDRIVRIARLVKPAKQGASGQCVRKVSLLAETLKQLINGIGAEYKGFDGDAFIGRVEKLFEINVRRKLEGGESVGLYAQPGE